MATTLDIQYAHGTRSFRVCLDLPEFLAACLIFRKLCSVFTFCRFDRDQRNSNRLYLSTTGLRHLLKSRSVQRLLMYRSFAAVQLHLQVNCSVLVILYILYHTFCYLSIVFLNFFVEFIFNITFTKDALTLYIICSIMILLRRAKRRKAFVFSRFSLCAKRR